MEHVLYRKYRPRSFDDTVGQEHVTKTLKQALKSGRISHAYLFTGPRGVGKTSVARILAHAVNKLAYRADSNHLDIIEIDAASNRRIDEIRELRERVRIAPAAATYKVYIIDEVHMLTKEAFNALLKTLEEPPAHTIFILATTEAHKLPETIISRTQRFEFKPVAPAKVTEHLKAIAKKEKIDISDKALNLLAEFGSGSFRDSIGYLDQLSTAGVKINEDRVRQTLGLPSSAGLELIISALMAGDSQAAYDSLQGLRESGVGAAELASTLSRKLRQLLIETGDPVISALLKQLIDVRASAQPYDYLEIVLLEAVFQKSKSSQPKPAAAKSKPIASIKAAPEPISKAKTRKVDQPTIDISAWPQVVELSKSRAASLYTALRLAKVTADEDGLLLSFQFPFHKKKVEQSKNLALISDLFEEISGQKIKISCQVERRPATSSPKPTKVDHDDNTALSSISQVFGQTEMMEA